MAIVAATVVALCACRPSAPSSSRRPAKSSFEREVPRIDPRARYLIVGGGGEPDSSEVQLERETELARATLAGPGVTLFGAGAGRYGVREDRTDDARPSYRESIGLLFLPRPRAARMRPPRFSPDGPATYETVTAAIATTLSRTDAPLVFVLSTHGEGAADPLDAYAMIWGNDALFVRDLVDLLREPSSVRPSRSVVGSCYGGAFAAIADVGRRDTAGAALHCGFFATEANRLASGCDGDPERSRHRGYLRSFFGALADPRSVDRDGDGRVTMLDAHLAAVVGLESIDVPVTTAEHLARDRAAAANLVWDSAPPTPSPESEHVIRALSTRLEVSSEAHAREALDAVREALDEREEELVDLESMRDVAWNRLRVALLERWPWLEDAYVEGWEARVERARREIEPVLSDSDLAVGLREADARVEAVAVETDELRVREAMLSRLVAAFELPRILTAIRTAAPAIAADYDALRACERFAPAVAHRASPSSRPNRREP